ncbi:peptidyl-tRNA hydrolase 2 [Phakopsora pachyrhizi]|uniref:peptidyl-tRNA hydrolase n=1 Tax=Phakopsora pachyrhizi TaxID=170000 RepID=A0AAV0BM47_PHAPC|nr:peptidyl-tRNA hydrolase 2 [Phakopsora pachyrhizi]
MGKHYHDAANLVSDQTFTYLALIFSSLTIGYWIGIGRSLGYTRGGGIRTNYQSSSDEEEVLVVRNDLGMAKGKIASQCSHATLACYKAIRRDDPDMLRRWERNGQTKIALKLKLNDCETMEDEMLNLKAKARSLGLCAQVIQDAGRTQIKAGSRTVLGIGPGPASQIDEITKHLKLL